MPLTISFEIDDATAQSLEKYLATQVRVENDPVTKAQNVVRMHSSPAAFLEDLVHQTIHQIVLQYPSEEIRQQLAAQRELERQIKESVRPKRMMMPPAQV